jgi:Flp pilus assembly protein TadD
MRRRFLVTVVLAALPLAMPGPASAVRSDAAEVASTRTLYLVLIRQARLDGKPRAALAYLDDFDRQHPGDREAKVLRVNCLLDLGQVAAAEAALAQIPNAGRSADALAVRGHVLAAQGRWSDAAGAYAAAQAASPADPFIGNALGYAQLRSGQAEQAVETLKRALDLAPDAAHGQAVARNNLALALTAAGRSAEAAALLAKIRDAGERARLQDQLAAEAARLAAPGAVP